jgi:hypothetical protein
MPVVVRAYGKDFDVDASLAHCTLPVCAVKRLGEPVFSASEPDGRRHTESGVHVLAGEGSRSMNNGWSMSALPPKADSRPQSQNVR